MAIITIKKENELTKLTPEFPCFLIERSTGKICYAFDEVAGFEIYNNKFLRKKYLYKEFTFERYDSFKGEINIKVS